MTTSWKLKLEVESVEVLQGIPAIMGTDKLKAFGRVEHYDIGVVFFVVFSSFFPRWIYHP